MLSRDSEDKIWSRYVFELVIWLREVTLARWTQPSGPLCLWQCLIYTLFLYILNACQVTHWELVSFLGFLLEPSPHALLHPRTTTSRTTQKYKMNSFYMSFCLRLFSIYVSCVIAKTIHCWDFTENNLRWRLRRKSCGSSSTSSAPRWWSPRLAGKKHSFMFCCVSILHNTSQWSAQKNKNRNREVMPLKKERNHLQIWSFPVWLQLVWIIYAAWDYDDATSLDQATPFIALSRQDPLSIDGKSLSEDGVDREEVGRSNVSEENFFR